MYFQGNIYRRKHISEQQKKRKLSKMNLEFTNHILYSISNLSDKFPVFAF